MPVPSYPAAFRWTFALWMVLSLMASWQDQATAQEPVLELSAPSDQPELSMHHPDISPDGQYIAASVSVTASLDQSTIWIFDRKTGKQRQLTAPDTTMIWGDVCARWSPDGKSILFVSDRNGTPGVYLVDINGASLRHLFDVEATSGGIWSAQADWSPDGERIIYPNLIGDDENQFNLFTYHLTNGAVEQVTEEDNASIAFPSWSSDGLSILCRMERDKRRYLVRIRLESGKTDTIVSSEGEEMEFGFPRLSMDGNWIAFQSYPKTYIVSSIGGEPREVLPPEDRQLWGPVWDGASHRLLYHEREVERGQVIVRDMRTMIEWTVLSMFPTVFAQWASWSPSGAYVSFLAGPSDGRSDSTLVIAAVNDRQIREVQADWPTTSGSNAPAWLSNSVIAYCKRDSLRSSAKAGGVTGVSRIVAYDVTKNTSTEVLYETPSQIQRLAVSHDGELIAFGLEQDIWIYDRVDNMAYQETFNGHPVSVLQFSTDDTALLFRENNHLYIHDLDSGETTAVSPDDDWQGPQPMWTTDREVLYSGAVQGGMVKVRSLNRDSGESRLVYGSKKHCWRPFRNQDGQVFLQEGPPGQWDMLMLDGQTEKAEEFLANATRPVFSNDGSMLVYFKVEERASVSIWSRDVSYLMTTALP